MNEVLVLRISEGVSMSSFDPIDFLTCHSLLSTLLEKARTW
jgi:hypothetical protein